MRLLHLADLHLDTPFVGRTSELRDALREASRDALSRAVQLALTEEVDAVLVAGDLFDGEFLSWGTERFLLREFGRLTGAGIPLFYATGNHDPGTPGGAARRLEWPEGVTLFVDPHPRRIPVRRGGEVVGWITGSGHAGAREAADLSRAFPRPEGSLPEVALLHTQVVGARGAENHDRYAPSELPFLREAGYHYWALGHIHVRSSLSDSPAIHYAGNLQGRSPRETGPKGGLLVELTRPDHPQVEFVELSRLRWEHITLALSREDGSPEALLRRVREAWSAARSTDPGLPGGEFLVRVELTGESPLAPRLEKEDERREVEEELAELLGARAVELRAGALALPVAVEEHLGRPDLLGEVLRLAGTLSDPGGNPSSLLGIEGDDLAGWNESGLPVDEYLTHLLEGADRELVRRLRRDDT